ncbi:DUF7006 family protein [Enterococcus faecalis]
MDSIQSLLFEIDRLLESVTEENFFVVMSKILGIDAKLQILIFFLKRNEQIISEHEIISMCEKDYKNYFKEICGYNLKDTVPHSLHFSVG